MRRRRPADVIKLFLQRQPLDRLLRQAQEQLDPALKHAVGISKS
jgi:hypothetical protein